MKEMKKRKKRFKYTYDKNSYILLGYIDDLSNDSRNGSNNSWSDDSSEHQNNLILVIIGITVGQRFY